MVIDDDIDREVHLARGRVIDQGHGVVDRVILDLVPLDEVDPEQIDERSVLLVADVPEIDDIGFDVEMLGDRLQRRCTGDRVRIRAVLSDDRQPRRCLLDDLRELPRIVLEFARLEGAQGGFGDDRGGVDDDVGPEFGEFVAGDGIACAGDDELVAVALADVFDGALVGLDVRGEDEDDIAVGNEVGDAGFPDVGRPGVQVLVTERFDAALVPDRR